MITATELRIGNTLWYDTGEGKEINTIDWQDLKWVSEDPDGFNEDHSPMVLTEELMGKIRCQYRPDGSRVEFSCHPPGERQVENNWYSHEVDDFSILRLSPSYDNWLQKGEPKFWFVWICSHGTGSSNFMSLKPIRGNATLRYFHQLQNLYYQLTGLELILKKPHSTKQKIFKVYDGATHFMSAPNEEVLRAGFAIYCIGDDWAEEISVTELNEDEAKAININAEENGVMTLLEIARSYSDKFCHYLAGEDW